MGRVNRTAYEGMIAEDLVWLEAQPRTLERDHIVQIVRRSPEFEYGAASEPSRRALEEIARLKTGLAAMKAGVIERAGDDAAADVTIAEIEALESDTPWPVAGGAL